MRETTSVIKEFQASHLHPGEMYNHQEAKSLFQELQEEVRALVDKVGWGGGQARPGPAQEVSQVQGMQGCKQVSAQQCSLRCRPSTSPLAARPGLHLCTPPPPVPPHKPVLHPTHQPSTHSHQTITTTRTQAAAQARFACSTQRPRTTTHSPPSPPLRANTQEIQHAYHTSGLLIKLLITQAESNGHRLRVDTSSLENEVRGQGCWLGHKCSPRASYALQHCENLPWVQGGCVTRG